MTSRSKHQPSGDSRRDVGAFARRVASIAVLCIPLPLPSAETPRDPASRPGAEAAAFLARIDRLRRDAAIPGLSVAVVLDGEIALAAGLGLADVERGVPATAETAYDIASVAKPLSGVVALRLVEDGVLDLDRPIAEYSDWKDFCRGFSAQPSIFARELQCEPAVHTLRHLLSHTATGEPGTRFSYNPVVYSWASRPMMAATDTRFSDLVARYVFEPADMAASARRYRELPLRAEVAERLARHYAIDDAGRTVPGAPRSPQGDGAAGGVVSTVLDLARFDIALDGGALLSPEALREMTSPTTGAAGEALPYAIGWYVQDHGGRRLLWHSGWWEDAWSALYLKAPEAGVSMILLANSEGIWWGNPLEEAAVDRSPFARAFLEAFVP